MKALVTLAALAGFAYGARHFYMFLSEKNKSRLTDKKLEVWEGEGGAVPVAADRTAAQVQPKNRSSASSPGVG